MNVVKISFGISIVVIILLFVEYVYSVVFGFWFIVVVVECGKYF